MVDFVERFFKLTLDNVYRFTCSLLFAVTVIAMFHGLSPLEQFTGLLDWLAIPSAWLLPIDEWLVHRQEVVGTVASLTLIVAFAFAAANDWRSRSGPTMLLMIVTLIQVNQGAAVFTAGVIVVACFGVVRAAAALLTYRCGWAVPDWIRSAGEKLANITLTGALAAAYLFSPLGWLIAQEPNNARGTRLNPFYINQVENPGPTGANGV